VVVRRNRPVVLNLAPDLRGFTILFAARNAPKTTFARAAKFNVLRTGPRYVKYAVYDPNNTIVRVRRAPS